MTLLSQLQEWMKLPQVHLPVILAIGVFFGWISYILLHFLFSKFDKHSPISFGSHFRQTIRFPVIFSIFLISCIYALYLCELGEPFTGIVKRIMTTAGVFVWTTTFFRIVTILFDSLSSHQSKFQIVQPQTEPLFSMAAKGLVLAAALYYISITWSLDITAWLASAGIVGIAVGFAAKDTLANLISGISIIADHPYKIGDYVLLDSGNVRGRVTLIGLRSTRILTRDDVEVILPNAIIANSMIINESGGPYEKFRVPLQISVAYKTDTDKVTKILESIADNEPLVVSTPAPRVRLRRFGHSGLQFELLVWIRKPELRGKALHKL